LLSSFVVYNTKSNTIENVTITIRFNHLSLRIEKNYQINSKKGIILF
jgi:hypothetical protein